MLVSHLARAGGPGPAGTRAGEALRPLEIRMQACDAVACLPCPGDVRGCEGGSVRILGSAGRLVTLSVQGTLRGIMSLSQQ